MNHGDFPVDILDEFGNTIDTKARQDVNKETDLFRGVYIIVIDGDGLIGLIRIPEKEEFGSKELYGGKWGFSAATIVRHGETIDDAARRAVHYDFDLDDSPVELLGETLETFDDGLRRQITVYKLTHNEHLDDLSYITLEELEDWIREQPEKLSPILLIAWRRYQQGLR